MPAHPKLTDELLAKHRSVRLCWIKPGRPAQVEPYRGPARARTVADRLRVLGADVEAWAEIRIGTAADGRELWQRTTI